MSTIKYNSKDYKVFCENNKQCTPFHNDLFMMSIILNDLDKSDIFIETGSFLGNTIYFVGANFENLKCYTCELQQKYFNITQKKVKDMLNVTAMFVKSPDALYKISEDIDIFNKKVCFWLDAHWKTDPLNEEIKYITENFKNYTIYIDDFVIPWNKNFTNDGFTIEKIKPFIANKNKISCYMPNYSHTLPECNNINNCGLQPCGYCILTTDMVNYDNISLLKKVDL